MVEVDGANMWSRYQAFYDFCQQPLHSLVNIVGASQQVQKELKTILALGLRDHAAKPNQMPNYAEPSFRIQCYDLPCDCPR